MRLLTNRLVIFFAIVGFGVSFLLGVVARVGFVTLFLRAVVSGVALGGVGVFGVFVLSRVLSPSDFEDLMALIEGRSVEVSESAQIEKSSLSSMEEREEASLSGSTINVVEDSDVLGSERFVEETGGKMAQEEVFDPAKVISSTEKAKDDLNEFFSSQEEISSEEVSPSQFEGYQQLKSEYENAKPTLSDNTVSFKVNDKKINTSPEIIAKAIKTILSKDS